MKRCCCCKILLPESDFYHNKTKKDGLQNTCKTCHLLRCKGLKADEIRVALKINPSPEPKIITACNGLKISVQSYAKKGEHIYNILETRNSQYYGFDDKEQFFIKLEELLERGM